MRVPYIILFILLCVSAEAATLHGAVYDSDYNAMSDVVLEINTTPKQNHISKNGAYFFNVQLGSYEITAEKFYQKELVYTKTQAVDITKDGEFNIDIQLELVPGATIPKENPPVVSPVAKLHAFLGIFF